MNNKKRELTIIMGRAASGKDTLAQKLISEDRTMVLSHTTRPRRKGEGDTHIFIDSIEPYSNRWLETTINGYSYFVTEDDLYKHDILVIDTKGFFDLTAKDQLNRKYKVYYVDVPMALRRERYMLRENATEESFIERNSAEDLQFTNFEELLCSKNFRKKHNIKVIDNINGFNEKTIDNGVGEVTKTN